MWQNCEWLAEDAWVSSERPGRLTLQFKEGPWRRELGDKWCVSIEQNSVKVTQRYKVVTKWLQLKREFE